MNAHDETLAGEYVLGTLSGDERAQFEASLAGNAALREAVEWWERKLAPLISAGPVPVAPHVWERIAARL